MAMFIFSLKNALLIVAFKYIYIKENVVEERPNLA